MTHYKYLIFFYFKHVLQIIFDNEQKENYNINNNLQSNNKKNNLKFNCKKPTA